MVCFNTGWALPGTVPAHRPFQRTAAPAIDDMKLSTRLTIAMVALVLFTAAAVGFFTYRALEAAILPQELGQLRSESRLRASELEAYVRGARDDVLGNRGASMISSIVDAHMSGGGDHSEGSELSTRVNRLASRLQTELEAKRSYLQFGIIGIADGGREIFRIERTNDGKIRHVPENELKREGGQRYFKEAISLTPGEVYFSRIELNRNAAGLVFPHMPVMRIATIVQQPDGQPFGLVVINVDMAPILERLRANKVAGEALYVADEYGNFLIHPTQSREFAFEFGKIDRFQNEFPQFGDTFVNYDGEARLIADAEGKYVALAAVSARFGHTRRVLVAEALPYSMIMAPVAQARWSLIFATLLACVAAIVCAIFLSRSLTGPLVRMTAAVSAFGRGQQMTAPVDAGGEVGVLAQAFERMAEEIRSSGDRLEESARRMRFYVAAVESSNHAFLTIDPDSKITAWNPGAERLFGFTADEAVGQDVALIIPEDKRKEAHGIRDRIHRLERVDNFETVRLAKGGHPIHVVLEASPIKSPSGRMLGSAVVTRDITAEKLAQEMFRLAVESCPSGMVMFDQTGRIVLVNTEMERLFDYRREELIGRPVTRLVPDGLHLPQDGNGASPAQIANQEQHRVGLRKDGTRFPVEVRQNPIHIRDGLHVLGTVVDISERLRNDRLKDEFVSTVSHELRTPLTSIAGSLGLLAGGAAGPLPDPTMRLLRIAHKNSERLVRLINDILDIEKIESGQVMFDLKRIEVRALVEQAIEANRGFADSFAVRVGLDAASVPAQVRADADRLVQVLTNLLSNAIKFSPHGANVTVAITSQAETVRISVRDRGPGIPADFKPRVFEKFAQADATDARQKGGTGLGLSIVKQIVTFLGGTVGFEDAPGGGTNFYIDLPRWELSTDAAVPSDAPRGRVLICDDDAAVAQTIAARLEREGFTPDIALTAADARIKAAADGYQAILMDLNLPDGDGISLIQELRAQSRHENTPIVVISAEAQRGRNDVRSSSLDVLDWLNKPIDIRILVDVLNRPLARNGGSRQHVLHIDDDESVQGMVSEALVPHCDVVSVASFAQAREALASTHFNLVVLDLMLSNDCGLDILPELRRHDGTALPVILYSARASNGICSAQVQAALTKSPQSIDHLILTLRKHMAGRGLPVAQKEVA